MALTIRGIRLLHILSAAEDAEELKVEAGHCLGILYNYIMRLYPDIVIEHELVPDTFVPIIILTFINGVSLDVAWQKQQAALQQKNDRSVFDIGGLGSHRLCVLIAETFDNLQQNNTSEAQAILADAGLVLLTFLTDFGQRMKVVRTTRLNIRGVEAEFGCVSKLGAIRALFREVGKQLRAAQDEQSTSLLAYVIDGVGLAQKRYVSALKASVPLLAAPTTAVPAAAAAAPGTHNIAAHAVAQSSSSSSDSSSISSAVDAKLQSVIQQQQQQQQPVDSDVRTFRGSSNSQNDASDNGGAVRDEQKEMAAHEQQQQQQVAHHSDSSVKDEIVGDNSVNNSDCIKTNNSADDGVDSSNSSNYSKKQQRDDADTDTDTGGSDADTGTAGNSKQQAKRARIQRVEAQAC
eukprot:13015-Heterococcus_DN1.PRE.1